MRLALELPEVRDRRMRMLRDLLPELGDGDVMDLQRSLDLHGVDLDTVQFDDRHHIKGRGRAQVDAWTPSERQWCRLPDASASSRKKSTGVSHNAPRTRKYFADWSSAKAGED